MCIGVWCVCVGGCVGGNGSGRRRRLGVRVRIHHHSCAHQRIGRPLDLSVSLCPQVVGTFVHKLGRWQWSDLMWVLIKALLPVIVVNGIGVRVRMDARLCVDGSLLAIVEQVPWGCVCMCARARTEDPTGAHPHLPLLSYPPTLPTLPI